MNRLDELLAGLRQQHPAWEIWRVDRYIGGPVWCARPAGMQRPVLNACEPADLSENISDRESGLPRVHANTSPAPYEEAAQRMRAVAAGLAAHGMTTYLHDSRERLDLTARLCPPGERETEILLDEDGYTEIRYWVHADAGSDEITAQALRVLAAGSSPAGQADTRGELDPDPSGDAK